MDPRKGVRPTKSQVSPVSVQEHRTLVSAPTSPRPLPSPLKRSKSDSVLFCKQSSGRAHGANPLSLGRVQTRPSSSAQAPGADVSILGQSLTSQPASGQHKRLEHNLKSWKKCVNEWYPELLNRTYFMPQIYTSRTSRETHMIHGVEVTSGVSKVTKTGRKGQKEVLYDCYVQEDRTQQHVLHCLDKISEENREVMFVMSQFSYNHYLCELYFSAAAKELPRSDDLKREGLNRGDFDCLVIHKTFGFLIGEIKSFGLKAKCLGWSDQDFNKKLLEMLTDTMKLNRRAVGQLQKAKKVLNHFNKDRKSCPRVRITLILPHVTRGQLRRALETDSTVRQALCDELDVPRDQDPVGVCLCADQMSEANAPWVFPQEVTAQLLEWWQQCLCQHGPDPAMTNAVYEDLVARFAGPASVVQVYTKSASHAQIRTLGQAVSDMADQLTDFTLYPSQMDVLNQAEDLAFLTGPPGTGKTLMLVLMAVGWMREEDEHVYIVSTRKKSRAASRLIYNQVKNTAKTVIDQQVTGRLHLRYFDLEKNETEAVEKLKAEVVGEGRLNIIADEVDPKQLGSFFKRLSETIPPRRLRLWAASMMTATISGLKEFVLQDPLRNPPSVVREIEQAQAIKKQEVRPFKTLGVSFATHASEKKEDPVQKRVKLASADEDTDILMALSSFDGPRVIMQKHVDGNDGHKGEFTVNCKQCGLNLGHVLLNKLHVGKEVVTPVPRQKSPKSSKSKEAFKGRDLVPENTTYTSVPIRYRDVFVLTFFDPTPNEEIEDGQILRGLRESGVPVRVVNEDDDDAIAEVAAMEGEDKVVMTKVDNILGLERKVVVWVGAYEEGDSYGGRLTAISRCAGQLIWIYR